MGLRLGSEEDPMCKQLLKALGLNSVSTVSSLVQNLITCPSHE